jgi:DNA replication protein DnaC
MDREDRQAMLEAEERMQSQATSSLQEVLTNMITSDEAKERGVSDITVEPIKCKHCGALLQPVGIFIDTQLRKKWIHMRYQDCECEGAKNERETQRRQEEQRKKEEEEEKYRARIANMVKTSKLGKRFIDRTFSNFKVNNKNKAAFDTAYKYANEFEKYYKDGMGLIFIGNYGTGKTHLAAAICHEVIKQNYQPIFGTTITLLGNIKATYDNFYVETNENTIIERYANCDLLVIDDLGKERPTEWAVEKLYYIINSRYENCLPIIITTNYGIDKLINRLTVKDNIETGEAIASRIYEMCRGVYMDWEDYRRI